MHEVIIQSLSKGDLSVCIHCVSALLQLTSTDKRETTTCKQLLGSTFFLHLHKSDVFRLDFGVVFMSLTTIFYLHFLYNTSLIYEFMHGCPPQ